MMNLSDADEYLNKHIEKEAWSKLTDDEKKDALEMAERYINSAFELIDSVKSESIYLYAICEQVIHLLVFDKERMKLQREGVSSYKVDDLSFQMNNSFISPMTTTFLKKYSLNNKKKLGIIV